MLLAPLIKSFQSTQRKTHSAYRSDYELLEELKGGRTAAFEIIFTRYYYRIFNLTYRMIGNYQEAQDLTQETFVRVLKNRNTIKNGCSFSSWIYRTATNLCLDELRKHRRTPIQLEQEVLEKLPNQGDPKLWSSPEKNYETKENQTAVWEVASRLPINYRLVLTLRELHGLKYAEIAEVMNTSVSAIETMLFRARKKFRLEYNRITKETHPKICIEMSVLISAMFDGELSMEKQNLVEKHLASCTKCQAAHADIGRTSKLYRSLVPILPPAALRISLLTQAARLLASAKTTGIKNVINTATRGAASLWRRFYIMTGGKALPIIASAAIVAAILGTGAVKLCNDVALAKNRDKEKAAASSMSPSEATTGRGSSTLSSNNATSPKNNTTESKSENNSISDNEKVDGNGTQGPCSGDDASGCSQGCNTCESMGSSSCCESTKDSNCSGMEESSSCGSSSSCDSSKSTVSCADKKDSTQPKNTQDNMSADSGHSRSGLEEKNKNEGTTK